MAAGTESRTGRLVGGPDATTEVLCTMARRLTAAAIRRRKGAPFPVITAYDAAFARIGETAARQALKRWGFFTAFAHPGSRRVLERLGFIAESASAEASATARSSVFESVQGRLPPSVFENASAASPII